MRGSWRIVFRANSSIKSTRALWWIVEVDRPWHLGLLFNRDDELATLLATHLRVEAPDAVIGMDEPYVGADDEDNTIPRFGEARGIPHVLIEIRNDGIRATAG